MTHEMMTTTFGQVVGLGIKSEIDVVIDVELVDGVMAKEEEAASGNYQRGTRGSTTMEGGA